MWTRAPNTCEGEQQELSYLYKQSKSASIENGTWQEWKKHKIKKSRALYLLVLAFSHPGRAQLILPKAENELSNFPLPPLPLNMKINMKI